MIRRATKRSTKAWRRAHPKTEKFWADIEAAAILAVQNPGEVLDVNPRVSFKCEGDFLRMRLPSGRELAYPFPYLIENDRGFLVLVHKDNQMGKWLDVTHFGRPGTWKGKLNENAVQAVARDIFAAAMPRLESAGYPVVLHLHDEIVAEVPEDFGGIDEFIEIITTLPPWAAGMPIAAKGDVRARFCKIKAAPENCSKIIEQSPEPREAHGLEPEIAAESAITVSPQNNTK
jgi:DNA polymerase